MQETGVDVWCLRMTAERAADFSRFLSAAEKLRAESFRADVHRNKFSTSRGVLRFLLGRYLDSDPASVEFEYGPHGKPFVQNHADLRFNISHSGDLALYAFSKLEVGVDVEQIRALPNLMNVARRFFSAAEATELASLPDSEKAGAFHRCWSRKEAYIKAVGAGLSLPLESFQVSLLPTEPTKIKAIRAAPGAEAEWILQDLPVAEDYAAALAVRAPAIDLWTSPVLTAEQLQFMNPRQI